VVESCADPTAIRSQTPGDNYWYMYCTSDPLNDADRNASGGLNFHKIPTLRSLDLVSWTYVGDAFAEVPSWGEPTAGMWAPLRHSSARKGLFRQL
jgi:arabinan endo-1,5-alpha-L-arabinosidase